MGSRNKQRPTFEKRQREIARQERQAEKRARRRARADGTYEEPAEHDANEHEVNEPTDFEVQVPDQSSTPGGV